MSLDVDTLRALLDACPDAILLADDDRKYVMVNPAACDLLGMTEARLLALHVEDVFGRPAQWLDRAWREFLARGERAGEARVVRGDGSGIDVEYRARAHVRPGRHLSVLRDVSERVRREQTASLHRGLARILQPATSARGFERALALCCVAGGWDLGAIWQLDDDEPRMRFVCGWTSPTFREGEQLLSVFQTAELEPGQHTVATVWATDSPRWVEDVERDPLLMFPAECTAAGLRSLLVIPLRSAGVVVGVMSLCSRAWRPRDPELVRSLFDAVVPFADELTRRRIERDVDRSRRAAQEARSLAHGTTATLHAERHRIAQDLHDSVGQTLTMAKLAIARARSGDDPSGLDHALTLVDDVIRQVRTMIFDLHPPMLEVLGLTPTLERYAELMTASSGLEVLVRESGPRQPLPPLATTYLFRAVKELVANVVKHAKATEVVVCVRWDPRELRITVDDDGVGMEPAAQELAMGLGLASTRDRIHTLDGTLEIDSRPGQGTRALLSMPLAASLATEGTY